MGWCSYDLQCDTVHDRGVLQLGVRQNSPHHGLPREDIHMHDLDDGGGC